LILDYENDGVSTQISNLSPLKLHSLKNSTQSSAGSYMKLNLLMAQVESLALFNVLVIEIAASLAV